MRKAITITMLVFVAIISATFNLLFLVNKGFYNINNSNFANIIAPINNITFYVTLPVILFVFFINKHNKNYLCFSFFYLSIVHILIMFSFIEVNYLYLIPIIFTIFGSILAYSFNEK